MTTLRERIEGGLWGLLVGDALGVPYEFHEPHEIPPREHIEMSPPPGFRRSYPDVQPGTWSDDGAQALCLLASLLYCNGFDAEDFGRRLQNWYNVGYLAVDGNVFDIGNVTRDALRRLADGTPALQAGARQESSNGNGSLMRVLPLVLWHQGTDAEMIEMAMQQSQVTHAHLRAQLCCALYCLWARGTLEGQDDAWSRACDTLAERVLPNSVAVEELQQAILAFAQQSAHGTGYIVDSLWSAKTALERPDFETAVRFAVALGNDTDTTACITGGLAGIRHGVAGIPAHWLDALREKETVRPMLDALLKSRGL